MRVEWPFIFANDDKFVTETYPPSLAPVHFAATQGESLLSYAAVLRLNLEHAGVPYRVYGFGNMFTFPPYRREGYGQRVLTLATQFIVQSDVDLAILFCDADLESFYAAQGWVPTTSPTYLGTPNHHERHYATRMMLFVSEHAKQKRADFDMHLLYIQSPW